MRTILFGLIMIWEYTGLSRGGYLMFLIIVESIHTLQIVRVEDIYRRNGFLLQGDVAALHFPFDFWKLVGEEYQVVLDTLGFGQLYAKLFLVDVKDQFRAVELVVVKLESQVVWLAKIMAVLYLDVFPFASLDPVASSFASGNELVQWSENQCLAGFENIGFAVIHDYDAAMTYF